MKHAAVIYCVALLTAVTSQAAGKRLGPAVRGKNARILLEQDAIHGHGAKSPSAHDETRQDANGDERVAKAELHDDLTSNSVMKDPVSSKLRPGDLEGTRHVYDKLKKLEDDAFELRGTSKWQNHLKMQLDESESFIREHGANNILRTLEEHSPDCHIVAHQVGRAAVRVTNDITVLLEMCESGCKIGCFHGVIMGLVIDSYDGDFGSVSKEEKKTYIAGVLRKMCDESTIGRSRQGTCIHGVGHAAVVAADGHDLKEGMEICMATFYDDRQKQHHCGTGVAMNEKVAIRQDPFTICSSLPLPASCFDHAFGAAPRKHVVGNTTALITFGKKESAKCTKLATVELQEACLYGLGTTIGRTIFDDEKYNPDSSVAEIKTRMSSAVKKLCLCLEDKAVRKACMLGMVRYANKSFGRPDAKRVICSPISDITEMEACVDSLMNNGGFSYMEHFAIQELPLDTARRLQ